MKPFTKREPLPCRHILLAVDACFGGTFQAAIGCNKPKGDDDSDRPAPPNRDERADFVRLTLAPESRLFFSSIGKETTSDNSRFARRWLEALQKGADFRGLLTAYDLRARLRTGKEVFGTFGGVTNEDAFVFVRNIASKDRDGDGVPDATDKCPDRYGTAANAGCPDDGTKTTPDAGPDTDFDGIPDDRDACPNRYGTAKANGCPDRDDDGVPDISDECPDDPGKPNWAGCPDSDGDGLHDGEDQCPTQKGTRADKGCPPPDSDGDGVPDKSDKCPNEAGKAHLEGCPEPPKKAPGNMALIKGGTFQMGCTSEQKDCYDDEKPVRSVKVTDFWLATTELTFDEYDAFCTATGRDKPADQSWSRGKRPAINVSWDDAVAYCNWRSTEEGLTPCYTTSGSSTSCNWTANGYRLPSEAEWEYAARAVMLPSGTAQGGGAVLFGNGKNTIDPAQINFDARADYKKAYSVVGEYRGKTVPVGSLNSPNALGLHDMSGNVWEWCWDWKATYPSAAETNPKGPASGSYRVIRGGSWYSFPQNCRSAVRSYGAPGYRNYDLGFRLARTP